MKKYYVIKLSYDHGFWNEEKQDFVGWLNVTKYEQSPEPSEQLRLALSKKPVMICEIFENE